LVIVSSGAGAVLLATSAPITISLTAGSAFIGGLASLFD
jgi:hypothetical protein